MACASTTFGEGQQTPFFPSMDPAARPGEGYHGEFVDRRLSGHLPERSEVFGRGFGGGAPMGATARGRAPAGGGDQGRGEGSPNGLPETPAGRVPSSPSLPSSVAGRCPRTLLVNATRPALGRPLWGLPPPPPADLAPLGRCVKREKTKGGRLVPCPWGSAVRARGGAVHPPKQVNTKRWARMPTPVHDRVVIARSPVGLTPPFSPAGLSEVAPTVRTTEHPDEPCGSRPNLPPALPPAGVGWRGREWLPSHTAPSASLKLGEPGSVPGVCLRGDTAWMSRVSSRSAAVSRAFGLCALLLGGLLPPHRYLPPVRAFPRLTEIRIPKKFLNHYRV